ncbi:zinc finger protein 366 [Lingula anatina]|uniref:Zinc finger protein 366 n=1 Tax=Lingula anatina TaxID=7574 RepID=A0A1S3IKB5_LINAN|nr:zinc finger protein 366 [Lingula anatina]|eukprot:XP_013398685.1 zinc finger protein 366 [Lingula anatina]
MKMRTKRPSEHSSGSPPNKTIRCMPQVTALNPKTSFNQYKDCAEMATEFPDSDCFPEGFSDGDLIIDESSNSAKSDQGGLVDDRRADHVDDNHGELVDDHHDDLGEDHHEDLVDDQTDIPVDTKENFNFAENGLPALPPELEPIQIKNEEVNKLGNLPIQGGNNQCPSCGRIYRQVAGYLKHIQVCGGKEEWKCTHCSYSTKHQSNIYQHLRVHTGERPYKCRGCGASFTQCNSLKQHIISRHGKEKVEEYYCLQKKEGRQRTMHMYRKVTGEEKARLERQKVEHFMSLQNGLAHHNQGMGSVPLIASHMSYLQAIAMGQVPGLPILNGGLHPLPPLNGQPLGGMPMLNGNPHLPIFDQNGAMDLSVPGLDEGTKDHGRVQLRIPNVTTAGNVNHADQSSNIFFQEQQPAFNLMSSSQNNNNHRPVPDNQKPAAYEADPRDNDSGAMTPASPDDQPMEDDLSLDPPQRHLLAEPKGTSILQNGDIHEMSRDQEEEHNCVYKQKLCKLRRNVVSMLTLLVPDLDLGGSGISAHSDKVDQLLQEIIYSNMNT